MSIGEQENSPDYDLCIRAISNQQAPLSELQLDVLRIIDREALINFLIDIGYGLKDATIETELSDPVLNAIEEISLRTDLDLGLAKTVFNGLFKRSLPGNSKSSLLGPKTREAVSVAIYNLSQSRKPAPSNDQLSQVHAANQFALARTYFDPEDPIPPEQYSKEYPYLSLKAPGEISSVLQANSHIPARIGEILIAFHYIKKHVNPEKALEVSHTWMKSRILNHMNKLSPRFQKNLVEKLTEQGIIIPAIYAYTEFRKNRTRDFATKNLPTLARYAGDLLGLIVENVSWNLMADDPPEFIEALILFHIDCLKRNPKKPSGQTLETLYTLLDHLDDLPNLPLRDEQREKLISVLREYMTQLRKRFN